MKKSISILCIIFRLFLGGFMIYGGIQKFKKPIPTPIEVLEKANKFSGDDGNGLREGGPGVGPFLRL